MNVFDLRNQLISDYGKYVRSFINIQDDRIRAKVDEEFEAGLLWPEPLIQLNPSFEAGEWIDQLVDQGILHQECRKIFRRKNEDDPVGQPLRLHKHQAEAIKIASGKYNYILTTGTGSGKSLAYIIPIVDQVLRNGSGQGIQAIIVYPMNALANSQEGELKKFLCLGYPDGHGPVTFARYTGQESLERKQQIIADPPDILLTNYVMMELILTRPDEKSLIAGGKGPRFLVLDELHTYRGRQGADVALLVRRTREAFDAPDLQCVGTSATLAGSGKYEEQRAEVSEVASKLFGATVRPEHVIGETLLRATPEHDLSQPEVIAALRERVQKTETNSPKDFAEFINDPLSSWIETTFGLIKESQTGRFIRAKPRSITSEEGAAKELDKLTGLPEKDCVNAIQAQLLASYQCEHPETGYPAFAFRLHQFISHGDTLFASLEPENSRYLTVHGQQFVPGSEKSKVLLPLVFCRECGQEYYSVRRIRTDETEGYQFIPRELSDQAKEESSEAGFLYRNSNNPWPDEVDDIVLKLPDDWLEEDGGRIRIKRDRRNDLPQTLWIDPLGKETNEALGLDYQYLKAPFRFCLNCGASYHFRLRRDFTKLTSLGAGGRATATTILSLAAILYLRGDYTLKEHARKLLSFTDNRQDASLQAGHFNDFIEVGLLRSALFQAVLTAGSEGLRHDQLVQRVFAALDLPLDLYAIDPDVRFKALDDTKRALREVIGYRLYRDLQRGWRITAPNLEQCGLLKISYLSLPELCESHDVWENLHPALATATPQTRCKIAEVLLDYMRRELAIKVDYLDQQRQERIQQTSSQHLKTPWAIDENEQGKMEHSSILFPRPRTKKDFGGHVFLSSRGGFGQYLRRPNTFDNYSERLDLENTQKIILQLLEALRVAGLVLIREEPRSPDEVPGYQIPASAFLWTVGDGTQAFYDPIRMPQRPESGGRTNKFFIDYYQGIATGGKGLQAREHTAQVKYEDRIIREEEFREGKLPILYCSPTMELGVDIAELNAVNLRNIPPTPANYAQRSGRAGRSGQPAIVFSYCSLFSPHDQYFFKRPELMVAGAVKPPRLDLANEDLLRSHIQAIWLAETGVSLGTSLTYILDVEGDDPSLALNESVRDSIQAAFPAQKARIRAKRAIDDFRKDLEAADWYSEGWLDEALAQCPRNFDETCNRWRSLYRAARKQREIQDRIVLDHSRPSDQRDRAKRLRAEAEFQIELLTESQNAIESDFYSYRYFACEGFLPGYNFPRLPLSAYIPGRRQGRGRNEYLSRPRFLAISEFGPRAIVYHEGSQYRINKVILPAEQRSEDNNLITFSVKQCSRCGYLHPIENGGGPDLCERCKTELPGPLTRLFRLQNVSTRRVNKINSDEEERQRMGYEIRTGFRLAHHDGCLSCQTARVFDGDKEIASLTYGRAATIRRINLGWMRRADKNQYGFVLDTERGYWAKNEQDIADDDQEPLSDSKQRVIPYVEDRKNCLILEPRFDLSINDMASLQAALKNAIQVEYQLEEAELATESLPDRENRRLILLYEAAEGGAGVLHRLIDDSKAFPTIAKQALTICHFDPETGEDLKRAPKAREDCEAACYDCLMSYTNQTDHLLLDRKSIAPVLRKFARSTIEVSPAAIPRPEHLKRLLNQCQSNLEKNWLKMLEENNLRLPEKAQALIPACKTKPDFLYTSCQAAIYIDGPPHDYPDRQKRDQSETTHMEDLGYIVIRFHHQSSWLDIITRHPNIFGNIK